MWPNKQEEKDGLYALAKDADGRFECGDFTLHSGDTVELLRNDNKWLRYRIEHWDGQYAAVGSGPLVEGEPARFPRPRGLVNVDPCFRDNPA